MDSALLALAALACPIGMGVMMWMMMRGQRDNQGGHSSMGGQSQMGSARDREVAELRSEVERLKDERAQRQSRAGEP